MKFHGINLLVRQLMLVLLVSGCATPWPATDDDPSMALLISSEAILELDGEVPDSPYRNEISPGSHSALVEYRTYTTVFQCLFQFQVESGKRYEIIDRANPEPLALFRSRRSNWLWATRHDPVAPVECSSTNRL